MGTGKYWNNEIKFSSLSAQSSVSSWLYWYKAVFNSMNLSLPTTFFRCYRILQRTSSLATSHHQGCLCVVPKDYAVIWRKSATETASSTKKRCFNFIIVTFKNSGAIHLVLLAFFAWLLILQALKLNILKCLTILSHSTCHTEMLVHFLLNQYFTPFIQMKSTWDNCLYLKCYEGKISYFHVLLFI